MLVRDMRKTRLEEIAVIVAIIVILCFCALQYYSLVRELYEEEVARGGKGYVSDEVWYVSSARNILNKVFGVKPRVFSGEYGVTIIYDKSKLSKALLENIVFGRNVSFNVVDFNYREIDAVYVESNNLTLLESLIIAINRAGGLRDVIWGWRLADAKDINNYLNLEHPPLAKYLIILSMLVFGDNPLTWRLPSIIAGVFTVFFTYLAALALTNDKWISLIPAVLTGVDPITRALSGVALLDIYVALFTSISIYFLLSRRPYHALVTALIGSLFKFNALFTLIPILYIVIRRDLLKEPSLTMLIYSLLKHVLLIAALFISLQILASIPLIIYGGTICSSLYGNKPCSGFEWWFENSIIGAIKWHVSIKCSGPGCPVSSAPWDWFIGNNGFPLYYFSATKSLVALGFWPLWSIALAYSLLFLPSYRLDRKAGYALLIFHGILSGYLLLYLIGGRTQYSFYAVQFTPIIYILLIVVSTQILFNPIKLGLIIVSWHKVLSAIWSFIKTYVFLLREQAA